jgi:hypothetical protein
MFIHFQMFRDACLEMLEFVCFLMRSIYLSNFSSFERELFGYRIYCMSYSHSYPETTADIPLADSHDTGPVWYVVNL